MNQTTDCSSVTFSLDDLVVNSDDLLPPFVKLERYSNSDSVLHRQIAARDIVDTLHSVITSEKEVDCIFRVFHVLAEDYEPGVRMEIMDRLPQVALLCHENLADAEKLIFQHFLPVIMKYLTDISNQVRKSAHASLLYMIEQNLICEAALEEKVLPLVLQLTETSYIDDYRTEAVSLLSKISSFAGKDVTERILVPPFRSLSHDASFHVRKICAESFGEICTVVGTEVTENILLPEFFLLCEDSVYGVRKASAEAFTAVSCMCSMDIRHKKLSSMFLSLLRDQSRWVKVAAFQSLGPFISTFAKPAKTGLYCDKDGKLTFVDVPNGIHTPSKVGFPSCELIKSICDIGIITDEKLPSKYNQCDKSRHDDDDVTKFESNKSDFSGSSNAVMETNGLESSTETIVTENSDVIIPNEDAGDYYENHDFHGFGSTNPSKCQSEQTTPSEDSEYILSAEEIFVNTIPNPCLEDETTLSKVSNSSQHSSSVLNSYDSCTLDFQFGNGDRELITNHLTLEESVTEEHVEIEICDNHQSSHNYAVNMDQPSIDSCDTSNAIISDESDEEQCRNENNSEIDVDLFNGEFSSKKDSEYGAFNSFQYWQVPLPEIDLLAEEFQSMVSVCDEPESQISSVRYKNSTVADSDDEDLSTLALLHIDQTHFLKSISHYQNLLDSKQKSQENPLENGMMEDVKKMVFENNLSLLRKCDFADLISIQSTPLKNSLSLLDQDIVPPELLLLYLSMVNFTKPPKADAEMARHCAYSFPAVALTLGRRFWPCLKQTYNMLASDMQGFIMQWKVRRTLASSMHKLALILGPDITARDLLPIFSGFIEDLDEVRIGILQHLSEFLEVLKAKERKEYLPRLSEFLRTDNDRNWRFRYCLAEQLIPIAKLYDPVDVRQHLIPLALTLLQDKVAEVRSAAVRVVATMVKRIGDSEDPCLTKELLTELQEFVNSRKWLHRQTYVYLCQEFVKQNSLLSDQFSENIMPQLLYLCWDQVANVRLAVARCLALYIWPLAYSDHSSPHRELLLQTIHAFQEDVDNDVKYFAKIVSTDECSCLLHGNAHLEEEPPEHQN